MREEDEYNTQQACILVLLPGLLGLGSAACTNSYNVGQLCQFFKKVN
jgi:hypothetical protein